MLKAVRKLRPIERPAYLQHVLAIMRSSVLLEMHGGAVKPTWLPSTLPTVAVEGVHEVAEAEAEAEAEPEVVARGRGAEVVLVAEAIVRHSTMANPSHNGILANLSQSISQVYGALGKRPLGRELLLVHSPIVMNMMS